MNLSVRSEYALHAVFDLAAYALKAPVRIADIAKRQSIPQKFLELILANLKQGGFVESRRGAEGGYRLARPADRITIGEVLNFVEGQQRERSRSKSGRISPFSAVWARLDDHNSSVLGKITFETLVRDWAEHERRFVPNWEI